MNAPLTLSTEELIEVTGKKRPRAQMRELRAMGIDFKTRTDGTICVFRHTIQPTNQNKEKGCKLNLSAI